MLLHGPVSLMQVAVGAARACKTDLCRPRQPDTSVNETARREAQPFEVQAGSTAMPVTSAMEVRRLRRRPVGMPGTSCRNRLRLPYFSRSSRR
jgi:hypothetical protein